MNNAFDYVHQFCSESLVHNNLPRNLGCFFPPSCPKMHLREAWMSNVLQMLKWGAGFERCCVIPVLAVSLGQQLQHLALCDGMMAILVRWKVHVPRTWSLAAADRAWGQTRVILKKPLLGPRADYCGKFCVRNRKPRRKLSDTRSSDLNASVTPVSPIYT